MEIVNGIIRKIVIVQDEMYFIRYKMLKFNIYIKMEGSETSELWKAFFELTGVEYNLDYKEEYEVN